MSISTSGLFKVFIVWLIILTKAYSCDIKHPMIERGITEALHKAQKTGDKKAEAQALALASTLKAFKMDGFRDVPLPTPEQRVRRAFTEEEKKALAKEGITAVYPLTGETIADQREKGRKFWYIAESDNNSLVAVHSLRGDVAIDPRPNKFFLPKSNNLTLDQQMEMVAEFSHKLQRRLKTDSVEAIMGQAPDYTELAFSHLDATSERLFGEKYDYNYARTQTPTVGSSVARVGDFSVGDGLGVSSWRRGGGSGRVFAVPLVVPK